MQHLGFKFNYFERDKKMFCFMLVLLDGFHFKSGEFRMTNSLIVEQMISNFHELSSADYLRCLYLAKLYYRHLVYIWLMVIG